MIQKHPNVAAAGDVICTEREFTFNLAGQPMLVGPKAPHLVLTDKFFNTIYRDYYCWLLMGPSGMVCRFYHVTTAFALSETHL